MDILNEVVTGRTRQTRHLYVASSPGMGEEWLTYSVDMEERVVDQCLRSLMRRMSAELLPCVVTSVNRRNEISRRGFLGLPQ